MMSNEKAGQAPGQDATPSMEEILQSIRGVISGDDAATQGDDVLELTEIVEVSEEPKKNISATATEASSSEKSILDDIDAALDTGIAEVNPLTALEPTPTPTQTISSTVETAPAILNTPEPAPIKVATTEKSADDTLAMEWEASAVADQAPAEKIEAQAKVTEKNPDLNVSQTSSEAYMTTKNDIEDTLEAEPIQSSTISENIEQHIVAAGSLIAEEVAKASSGTLKELVNSVTEKHVISPTTRNGTSLEELVIEAIKPFLADWLNKNLPAIVKKIVEKEVKRLIPKEDDEY